MTSIMNQMLCTHHPESQLRHVGMAGALIPQEHLAGFCALRMISWRGEVSQKVEQVSQEGACDAFLQIQIESVRVKSTICLRSR